MEGDEIIGRLDHTSDMSREEHREFTKAFGIFEQQTDFKNESTQIMLKYYVQMAFLEGWKKSKKFNIDVIDM